MSDRKFSAIVLLAAAVVSASTFATFGLTGMIIYQTTWWLVVPLFGPFGRDEAFTGSFHFGIVWPWVVAAVLIAMRSRRVAEERSPSMRRLQYAAVVYGTTLLLAVIVRAVTS